MTVTRESIESITRWRGIGHEFSYMGCRMYVVGHHRVNGTAVEPGIEADYYDIGGGIRRIWLPHDLVLELMKEQP